MNALDVRMIVARRKRMARMKAERVAWDKLNGGWPLHVSSYYRNAWRTPADFMAEYFVDPACVHRDYQELATLP